MLQQVIISSISGTSYPYNVYLCDYTLSYCDLVTTVNSSVELPIYIDLPSEFSYTNNVIVKLVDSNGCEVFTPITCTIL